MPEAGQLSTLPLVDPQLAGTGWNYRPVPANDPRPLPVTDRPLTLDKRADRISADGSRGQFVYLDRPHAAVVVKTSDWASSGPLHDRQRRDLSYSALATIAEAARLSALVKEVLH